MPKSFIRLASLVILIVICFIATVANGSDTTLSEDVLDLINDQFAGYRVACYDYYDGGAQRKSVVALVVKKDKHNVLCVLEKEAMQSTYHYIVQSDMHIYQGDALPTIQVENNGDTLRYSYLLDAGVREQYSFVRKDVLWGNANVSIEQKNASGQTEMLSVVFNTNEFVYHEIVLDDKGNTVSDNTSTVLYYLKSAFNPNLMAFSISQYPRNAQSAESLVGDIDKLTLLSQIKVSNEKVARIEIWGEADFQRPILAKILYNGGTIQLLMLDVEQWADNEFMFIVDDVNFDGQDDFRICKSIWSSNRSYQYFGWDSEKHVYTCLDSYDSLAPNPVFDSDTKTVVCEWLDGTEIQRRIVYAVEMGHPIIISNETLAN